MFLASKAAQPEHCAGFAPLALSIDDIADYVDELRKTDLGIPVEVLSTFPLCALPEQADLTLRGRRCLAGIAMLTISADGSARPCNHTDQTYGNIFETPLTTLWEHMSVWREGAFLPATCQSCPALMFCGGGCRMEAKTRNGHLNALDPYARPENLPQLCKRLRTRTHTSPNFPHRFTINAHRLRREECGVVLCTPGGAPLLISQAGAEIWSQLENGRTYASDDPAIRWGTLDASSFLAALLRKKLITAVEESS